jgi:antitoxin component YwqK of YwqJK toxin-antitoxin module
MKNTWCFILLLITIFSSFGMTDVLRRYPSGAVKIEGSVVNGSLEGQVKKYTETGVLFETATYQDNLLNGEKRKYHSNGSVAVVETYVRGKIDGIAETFYDTGEKELVLRYAQGTLQHYTAYTKSGAVDLDIDYTKR